MGFNIEATRGTAEFLKANGIRTRIRKKLGPDVITTIRGLGYSLDDPAEPARG